MKLRLARMLSVALLAMGCANTTKPAAADPAPQIAAAPANGPLWSVDGGAIVPASGSADASTLCRSMSIALERDAAAPPPPAPKPIGYWVPCHKMSLYNGYLRSTLFIEGLDGSGARLFVAMGFNPLHQDLEVPPPPSASSPASGGAPSWQAVDTPATLVSTQITAPFTRSLARLRWYDVDENYQPRLIGETLWMNPPSQ